MRTVLVGSSSRGVIDEPSAIEEIEAVQALLGRSFGDFGQPLPAGLPQREPATPDPSVAPGPPAGPAEPARPVPPRVAVPPVPQPIASPPAAALGPDCTDPRDQARQALQFSLDRRG